MICPKPFLWIVACFLLGCGESAAIVDDGPFRAAIQQYLQTNNMAMKVKDVKQPLIVSGDTAQMDTSLTHEQLGGPAVTWHFEFAKQSDGSWRVTNQPSLNR